MVSEDLESFLNLKCDIVAGSFKDTCGIFWMRDTINAYVGCHLA